MTEDRRAVPRSRDEELEASACCAAIQCNRIEARFARVRSGGCNDGGSGAESGQMCRVIHVDWRHKFEN